MLSTPSLGITYVGEFPVIAAGLLLSTPSLGITGRDCDAAYNIEDDLSTPSLGITGAQPHRSVGGQDTGNFQLPLSGSQMRLHPDIVA